MRSIGFLLNVFLCGFLHSIAEKWTDGGEAVENLCAESGYPWISSHLESTTGFSAGHSIERTAYIIFVVFWSEFDAVGGVKWRQECFPLLLKGSRSVDAIILARTLYCRTSLQPLDRDHSGGSIHVFILSVHHLFVHLRGCLCWVLGFGPSC